MSDIEMITKYTTCLYLLTKQSRSISIKSFNSVPLYYNGNKYKKISQISRFK